MKRFFFKKKDKPAIPIIKNTEKPKKKRNFDFLKTFLQMLIFSALLFIFIFYKFLYFVSSFKLIPKNISEKIKGTLNKYYVTVTKPFDNNTSSISRIDLIELAVRNMRVKKTRTMITIGGMAIGIGAIVFLVSLGYGLEKLVTSKVARLEELKQADVFIQAGSKIKIDDKTLSSFKDIKGVEKVLPLIAVVGRVNYQNSVSDMAVYGVTSDFLKENAIKPTEGRIFDSNDLAMNSFEEKGEVAGEKTEQAVALYGGKIQDLEFTINPDQWVRVRQSSKTGSRVLGYTKRIEGKQTGEEYWGGEYPDNERGSAAMDSDGNSLGRWIKAPVFLWEQKNCRDEIGCEEGKYFPLYDNEGKQVQKTGYFAEVNIQIEGFTIKEPLVLGISDINHGTVLAEETNAGDIAWVEIASESGLTAPPETKKVDMPEGAKKVAVVNQAMLKVLGLKDNEAVGKIFDVSFVITSDLLSDSKEKIESNPSTYSIVGLIPEGNNPIFYVPFIDLRSLGITNYSQVKVVVKDQAVLPKTRMQISAMGYTTRSVSDTVDQINSLFSTVRTILGLLGMVALAVASLGMFNTLTVSLLERTREVGLMKALGMKSSEVKELFLTESMVMGIFGGILGIIFGFLLGKILALVLTFFAIFKGVGIIDVSFIPISFVLLILVLSLAVGLFTGIFPAKRATKISALNALRYE